MKLCIPIPDAGQGGVHSFFRIFRQWLAQEGIPVVERLDEPWDALVVNSWVVPYRAVLRAKREHPEARVLHRIDGSARDYGREAAADRRQARVNTLADVTVFQSRYGRHATREKFAVIGQDGPVIHNPVDLARFRPDGERIALTGTVRICHVAYSTNPMKGAAALLEAARRNPDVTFVLVGRYQEPPALPNVVPFGPAGWDVLPRVLRSTDGLAIFAENETCPNVVLEALASGLPILYRDSGGTAELVGDCGAPVTPETFGAALGWVQARREALSRAARRRAEEQFAPGRIFPRYLEALRAAPQRPIPGRLARLGRLLACGKVSR